MPSISKTLRDALASRFTLVWAGIVNAREGDYTVTAEESAALVAIDWTALIRPQFFQGQINPDSLDDSTSFATPVVTLSTDSSVNDQRGAFQTWCGSVAMSLTFHLNWLNGAAIPAFDELGDLVQDCVVETLHDKAWIGALGTSGITYNGEFGESRTPVVEGDSNWSQQIIFKITYGVDV